MVKSMKAEGIPISGIGMQGHYNTLSPTEDEFRKAIELYSQVVDNIHITEPNAVVVVHARAKCWAGGFPKTYIPDYGGVLRKNRRFASGRWDFRLGISRAGQQARLLGRPTLTFEMLVERM